MTKQLVGIYAYSIPNMLIFSKFLQGKFRPIKPEPIDLIMTAQKLEWEYNLYTTFGPELDDA